MTIEDLQSRRVGVLGFGQEGQAVTTYLLRHGIKPVLFDKRGFNKFSNEEQTLIQQNGLTNHFGTDYLNYLPAVDVVFRSPGIWLLTPQLQQWKQQGGLITSQAIWFFQHCPAPIIGVTGTKGKGTTASLVAHILKRSGRPVYLTGNVGQIQPLDFLDQLTEQDHIVYELSSFQLQDLPQSPHLAIVLMVTSDHLDVHTSAEEYRHAKTAITKFQTPDDTAIINTDYHSSREIGELGAGHKLYFSRLNPVAEGAYVEQQRLVVVKQNKEQRRFDLSVLPLRGQHNWDNAAAAILASLTVGVAPEAISQALPSFQALPHRLQQLPDQAGIQFFDDSISTVPETAAAAIAAFSEPLIVLTGGYDKGLDPEPLLQALLRTPNIKAVVTLGATGLDLASQLQHKGFSPPILQNFANLTAAMQATKTVAKPGDVVLLSPGYASFDWYDNYKQRGDDFARLAAAWSNL